MIKFSGYLKNKRPGNERKIRRDQEERKNRNIFLSKVIKKWLMKERNYLIRYSFKSKLTGVAKMSESNNKPYWKVEEPEIVSKDNINLKVYKKHGALQIALFGNDDEGNSYIKHGLNLRKHRLVKQPEVLNKLIEVFNDWLADSKENKG